jgi:hypothetical protein
MLLRYWRLLFYARVRGAVQAALASAPLPRAAVQERIERLGRTVFNEARFVLQRERYLAASCDDCEAYAEFAALYLDFACFAPAPLPWFFAAIEDPARVLECLGRDVDREALIKATRPPGAADPQHEPAPGVNAAPPTTARTRRRVRRDAAHREKLLAHAVAADAVGNDVRAAIFRMRVYRASGSVGPSRENNATVYAEALRDLDQLTARLNTALNLDDAVARQWRAWMVALLENAAGGWWNAEGRLLYDIQKVCVYHEREIYSVNVVDYLVERGRRPLRRPQPGQRIVLSLKSLRSALRRTARARLSPHGRAELRRLLQLAIDDVEHRLREFLRPPVTSALDDGGLHPATATETVARAKLTEELIDEIVDTGYLKFPAVRDAISNNQMKLADLADRAGNSGGDQLLRTDRKLEENLDFVYHRGEVYLRGFHRLSSVFFATRAGRLVTRWVILPFGGAFVILEALDHSLGLLIHKVADKQHVVAAAASSASHAFGPTRADVAPQAHQPIFNQWWLLLLLGVFLFGVVNAPPFRAAVARFFRDLFRALRVPFVDFPKWVATRPLVQAVFSSQFARLLGRYVVKPLVLAAFVYTFLPDTFSRKTHMLTLGGVFLTVNVLLNSRAGRAFEQAVLHAVRTTFARFTWEILLTVIRRIVQVFQSLLEALDRLLYAVDELLRFRAGQKRSTVAVKAIAGVFWFFIAYATRFIINLLVEPQINPIKHFPVVTVSHKLLFPVIFPLKAVFQTVGVGEAQALTYATGIIWCIPGIFGFLAWEFKENWKLYKANRSKILKPVRVGSHGETLATFLRPGFHSGTVPKIFHRLRKAQLRQDAPLEATNKHLHAAHHVEHALTAFFEREFIALLNRHPLFRESPIRLGSVHLAATVIRVEFHVAATDATVSTSPLTLSFEQRAAWILAGVDRAGWVADLTAAQSRHLSAALLGLYKLAGADLIREHVASVFPDGARFEFRRNDLIVWPTADFLVEATYDLSADGPLVPRYSAGTPDVGLPTLAPCDILFNRIPLPRDGWIGLWDSDVSGGPPLPALRVLPPGEARVTPILEVARAT